MIKVAVIGAGIAGLTLADSLKQEGAQVEVFEKSRGLGGRLANKRLPWGQFNIGAQYFTATTPRFRRQVDLWVDQGAVIPWNMHLYQETDAGLTSSKDEQTRFIGQPGMNSIVHTKAQGLKIHLNTRIIALEKNRDTWALISESKEFPRFNWVVSSMPLAQANQLIYDSEALSNLNFCLPSTPHQPCWVLAIQVDQPPPTGIEGIMGLGKPVDWASCYGYGEPDQQVTNWLLHFSSDWSQNDQVLPEMVLKAGQEWLLRLFPGPMKILAYHCHFWRYASSQCQVESISLTDQNARFICIGDWCAGGRVEGAYLSACQAASILHTYL